MFAQTLNEIFFLELPPRQQINYFLRRKQREEERRVQDRRAAAATQAARRSDQPVSVIDDTEPDMSFVRTMRHGYL